MLSLFGVYLNVILTTIPSLLHLITIVNDLNEDEEEFVLLSGHFMQTLSAISSCLASYNTFE